MSKYHAIRVYEDGHSFASKREHRRYCALKDMQLGHEIENLELQPKFPLIVAGVKVATYIADFRYRDCRTGDVIVEDAKGVPTPVYKLKKKLVKAIYDIDVVEV